MDNQKNIKDELRGLDSELPLSAGQPFSVPEGYFDNLAAQILAKAKGLQQDAAQELQEISPLLAGFDKTMPYQVPEGYFTTTLSLLPEMITGEAEPVLRGISKSLPYQVPEGYFDSLPEQVLAKVTVSTPAKVVPLFARTWMRVAAAALIGGAVLFGGYQLVNQNSGAEAEATLAQTADTTENLVARNESVFPVQDMKNVSTEDLDDFIQTVPINPAKMKATGALSAAGTNEVGDLLKDISTKELDLFLEQLPTADANLLVID